jgi:hypothetical protein
MVFQRQHARRQDAVTNSTGPTSAMDEPLARDWLPLIGGPSGFFAGDRSVIFFRPRLRAVAVNCAFSAKATSCPFVAPLRSAVATMSC